MYTGDRFPDSMAGDARQKGFCRIEEHFEGFEGVGREKRIKSSTEDREEGERYLDAMR